MKLGTFKFDNLFAGTFPTATSFVTVTADLARGTVLGLVITNGQAAVVDSTKADGSEKPYAILAEDATAGNEAAVYLTGEFNENALIFGGTDTADTHRRELRDIGIFLKKNIEV